MNQAVLLAGGGTGGHVFPSLAVAAALRDARPDLDIGFVGTTRGLESRLVPEAGWPLFEVGVLPLNRRPSLAALRIPSALLRASSAVAGVLRGQGAVGAAVFGGYVSLPLALAAWRTGTPYVVHEQNAIPGLANRIAARRAAAVAVTFPSSVTRLGRRVPVQVTGNPVRPGLADTGPEGRAAAAALFGLDPRRRTLLVFGGSQGAQRINAAVAGSLGRWRAPEDLQILHATGLGRAEQAASDLAAAAGAAGSGNTPLVRAVEFIDRMDLAYAAADVVVARSGASTIAELTVLGLPSVLVPYPHATADHQMANACDLTAAGAATVVADADLDGAALVAAAEPLLYDDAVRLEMAAAARRFGRPDAAARVAAMILQAAER